MDSLEYIIFLANHHWPFRIYIVKRVLLSGTALLQVGMKYKPRVARSRMKNSDGQFWLRIILFPLANDRLANINAQRSSIIVQKGLKKIIFLDMIWKEKGDE